jgi:hypothetical protein
MGSRGRPNMSAKAWHRSCMSLVLVLWQGLSLPCSEMCSFCKDSMMLCIPGDMGWLTIGSIWYRLGPGVGARKVGGDGECMGLSGVWVEGVDGVGNGTLAGSTCMGEGGHTTSMGAGGIGTDAGAGGMGGG